MNERFSVRAVSSTHHRQPYSHPISLFSAVSLRAFLWLASEQTGWASPTNLKNLFSHSSGLI